MIQLALRARLLDIPAIVELLGGAADAPSRICPLVLPQKGNFPAITYEQIFGDSDRDVDGPTGLSFARVVFNCWDPEYSTATKLLKLVRQALDGYTGNADGVHVQGVEFSGDRDSHQPPLELFIASGDAEAWYEETPAV